MCISAKRPSMITRREATGYFTYSTRIQIFMIFHPVINNCDIGNIRLINM